MTPPRVDVNCDCGELPAQVAAGVDDQLTRTVTSVNIACGGHAGDEVSMTRLVRVAKVTGTRIGAHPSYPDPARFGRVSMKLPDAALRATVREQVERLLAVCTTEGAILAHIKPHGALYHDCNDATVANIVGEAVIAAVGRDVPLVAAATSAAREHWQAAGLRVIREAFADRAYERDGSLRSRSLAGATLQAAAAAQQAVMLATQQAVIVEGERVHVPCDTICVHGDGPDALTTARAVVHALRGAGVNIVAWSAS